MTNRAESIAALICSFAGLLFDIAGAILMFKSLRKGKEDTPDALSQGPGVMADMG